jgi:hypothetical protein
VSISATGTTEIGVPEDLLRGAIRRAGEQL